jgi:O-antigen/teichoic acid export membrane protein
MIATAKNHLRRLLPKNDFARGVSVLVGGTAGAQLLSILAAPLLTRLYRPEDFGVLAVYASLLALIGVISSLRYELAIPIAADDAEAANVAALSLALVLVSTLLTATLVLLAGPQIADVLGVPVLGDYLWLLPLGVLLAGTYNVFHYWSIRTKRFTTIAGTKLRQALAAIAIQLAAFKLGGIALLYAQVTGQSVGTISLGRPALATTGFRRVSWTGALTAARRYRRFPMFTTWAALVNTAGHQLPPLMFAGLFSASAAGFYALAHRILTLPANLIGTAIGSVFLSHAAAAKSDETLGDLYLRLQDYLVHIALPPAAVIIVCGPFLFTVVFGDEWRVAGTFAQLLAVGILAGFVVSPLSNVFTVLERQDVGLMLQLALFFFRVIAIMVGAWTSSIEATVAFFALASLLGYSLYLYMMPKYLGLQLTAVLNPLKNAAPFALAAIAPVGASFAFDFNYSRHVGLALAIFIILLRYSALANKSTMLQQRRHQPEPNA